MDIESWKREKLHNQHAHDRLEEANARTYRWPDLVVSVRASWYCHKDEDLARAARAHVSDIQLQRSNDDGSTWWDMGTHTFMSLNAEQMCRVAACVDRMQSWCDGKIAEIPTDPPSVERPVSDMLRGLVRAAEFKEKEDGGKIWDDQVRLALEAARLMGWGKDKVGQLPIAMFHHDLTSAGFRSARQRMAQTVLSDDDPGYLDNIAVFLMDRCGVTNKVERDSLAAALLKLIFG